MKVLLAIDSSQASQAAQEEVAARPWPVGSTFEVLSVIEPSTAAASVEGARELVRRVETAVQKAVSCLRSQGWEAGGGALADDNPKVFIIDRAKTLRADLVVVGSHTRSALRRFLLGSVAQAVLRYAPCSVEIVRTGTKQRENPQPFKVLLATDGSECSALATSSVAERALASRHGESAAEVILPARRALLELPFLASAIEEARAEGITRSRDAVAAAAKILPGTEATLAEPSAERDVRSIILAEAAQWGADLIVLGSHGLRGIDRFQLGSVSEAVALYAPCSVEIIRKRRE